jgi:uncharacterized membrane protein YgdD (TMEM256/DUF423 family)
MDWPKKRTRRMKTWLLAAAVNGFLAVAAGAFATHALSRRLSADALSWFETGARYHAYHALALLAIALLSANSAMKDDWSLGLAGGGFLAGIILFCGSLYLMALTGTRALGFVTPVGGVCFLAGWIGLGLLALRQG